MSKTVSIVKVLEKVNVDKVVKRREKIERLFQVTLMNNVVSGLYSRIVITGCRVDCQNVSIYIDTMISPGFATEEFVLVPPTFTTEMMEHVERQSVAVIDKEREFVYQIRGFRNKVTLALDLIEEMQKGLKGWTEFNYKANHVSRKLSLSLRDSIVKSHRKVSNCMNASEKVKRAILGGLDSMDDSTDSNVDKDKVGDEEHSVILISDSEDEEDVFHVPDDHVTDDHVTDVQGPEDQKPEIGNDSTDPHNDSSLMVLGTPRSDKKHDKPTTNKVTVYDAMIQKLTCDFQQMKSPSTAFKTPDTFYYPDQVAEIPLPCSKKTSSPTKQRLYPKHLRFPDDHKHDAVPTKPNTEAVSENRGSSNVKPSTQGTDEIVNCTNLTPRGNEKRKSKKKKSNKRDEKRRELEIPRSIAKDKLKKHKSKSKKREREKENEPKHSSKRSKRDEKELEPEEIDNGERPSKKRRTEKDEHDDDEDKSTKKHKRSKRDKERKDKDGKEKERKEKRRHKSGDKKSRSRESESLRYVVIDGSNVAMEHGKSSVFSCKGLRLCVDYFKKRGHNLITVFLPMWRKCRPRDPSSVKDRYILDDLEAEGYLVYTPSRQIGSRLVASYDDRFILELADREDGIVVSNDQYRDLVHEKWSWKKIIHERLLQYVFVHDHFMVADDPLGRHGPNLDTFLRHNHYDSDVAAKFRDEFKTLKQPREAIKLKRHGKLSKCVLFHQENTPVHKSAIDVMAAINERDQLASEGLNELGINFTRTKTICP